MANSSRRVRLTSFGAQRESILPASRSILGALFDPFSERWFAVSVENPGADNNVLIAVSRSVDPTRGWVGFAIDSDSTDLRTAHFPMLGFNKDGVYVAADMFPIPDRGAVRVRTTIVVIPKRDLMAAQPTAAFATKFENIHQNETGFAAQPVVDLDNKGLPAAFLSSLSQFGLFKRSNVTGDIDTPTLDTFGGFISVTPFLQHFSAQQPDPKPGIEIVNGSVFHTNIIKRNGFFWGVHTVGLEARAGLRWFQIDANTNELVQEGLISDVDLDFYYGSIAVNEFDDVVIGFNGSGQTNL